MPLSLYLLEDLSKPLMQLNENGQIVSVFAIHVAQHQLEQNQEISFSTINQLQVLTLQVVHKYSILNV